MTPPSAEPALLRQAFEQLLVDLRPKLHRYCARVTGSVVDGEDVLQQAFLKAIEGYGKAGIIANPENWLFRIAHNTALDFLRQRNRTSAVRAYEDLDMVVDPISLADNREIAAASLRSFMRLPIAQRSTVILMDVLGYSLEEIARVVELSVSAVKASLHRGRLRLREIAQEPEHTQLPMLDAADRLRLSTYIDRFNARDFDAIREMLADDVKLELVNRANMNGAREVGRYFHNYSGIDDWELFAGSVDGRPAILVRNPHERAIKWTHFVLLEWADKAILHIRDFRHAAYVIENADVRVAA
jgi:RNA polymerase sigma-70 factor (ECF subfamily)